MATATTSTMTPTMNAALYGAVGAGVGFGINHFLLKKASKTAHWAVILGLAVAGAYYGYNN